MAEQEITGRDNNHYRSARSLKEKKGREEHGLFLAEGIKVLEVLLESGMPVSMLFYENEILENERGSGLLAALKKKAEHVFIVPRRMLEQLAPSKNPQGIVAAVPFMKKPGADFGDEDGLYLTLDNVSEPGNLGAIFRTAWAVGARGIILTGEHADPYNPKVVRASAGGLFKVPFMEFSGCKDFIRWLQDKKITPVAAVPAGGDGIAKFKDEKRVAIVLGSEAHGISNELLQAVDKKVSLPLAPGVESLNLAVTAGILAYFMTKL
ncbi:MAG: RNA methyltransferase [Chloroflexi bacterium]|nr:RNA methyltransferase [Chloroflexota bacterium]